MAFCPEHGAVHACFALQYTVEGTLTLRISARPATEREARKFAERFALQSTRRRRGRKLRDDAAKTTHLPKSKTEPSAPEQGPHT
jgi:hypothetical protein